MIWEKMDRGRYAAEYNGHVLQAVRRDGPYEPDERPYVAIVDRVPIGDAWNLNLAKTKAIKHVEREHTRAKAERVFSNGTHAPEPAAPTIPDPVDAMLLTPEVLEVLELKQPEPDPVPPEPEPATKEPVPQLTAPLQLAITGRLTDSGDLLATLNALHSALELLREHAELDCTVNLPPVLKL